MRNESDKDEFQIVEVMEVKYLGDQF